MKGTLITCEFILVMNERFLVRNVLCMCDVSFYFVVINKLPIWFDENLDVNFVWFFSKSEYVFVNGSD